MRELPILIANRTSLILRTPHPHIRESWKATPNLNIVSAPSALQGGGGKRGGNRGGGNRGVGGGKVCRGGRSLKDDKIIYPPPFTLPQQN